MTPEDAIESLNTLLRQAHSLVDSLEKAAALAQQQWEGLRRCGGQRADMAAELLTHVSVCLAGISQWADRCNKQIIAMRADPFGREENHG